MYLYICESVCVYLYVSILDHSVPHRRLSRVHDSANDDADADPTTDRRDFPLEPLRIVRFARARVRAQKKHITCIYFISNI